MIQFQVDQESSPIALLLSTFQGQPHISQDLLPLRNSLFPTFLLFPFLNFFNCALKMADGFASFCLYNSCTFFSFFFFFFFNLWKLMHIFFTFNCFISSGFVYVYGQLLWIICLSFSFGFNGCLFFFFFSPGFI